MNQKCLACGAPCDGDVCDWQCAERLRTELEAREPDEEEETPEEPVA